MSFPCSRAHTIAQRSRSDVGETASLLCSRAHTIEQRSKSDVGLTLLPYHWSNGRSVVCVSLNSPNPAMINGCDDLLNSHHILMTRCKSGSARCHMFIVIPGRSVVPLRHWTPSRIKLCDGKNQS
ncbi:hypothetical protein PoB_002223200 [Plakobranchus ocellatus]|uniref:Uncharacterized protein n=1 Tax=Plakobranchus ocellatus TaxID=259542 RepID=A0AAV3ZM42_9GAST|nr:hypothetical protein PoB_002223200 [Plakobranchus ocellatus]